MDPRERERRAGAELPATLAPEEERALSRLLDLLSISAPAGEEGGVRDYILKTLGRIGVPREAVRVDDAPSRIDLPCQTGNVIVFLPGTAPGPRLLVSAHMDTVPLARSAEPVVRGGRIVAMGETALGGDDRTGVAAVLSALVDLQRLDLPHPPLTLLFTVREESGLCGARAVRIEDLGSPLCGFNFDGGPPGEVTIGATGSRKMDIDVQGVAAHAGLHPERGVSAIAIFAAATVRLERDGWLGAVRKPEGVGTSNIGAVQGGEATNVVTERLAARAEARSHDPRFLPRIVEEFRKAFVETAGSRRSETGAAGSAEVRSEVAYESFRLSDDEPAVLAALAAIRAAGIEPKTRISNGGLDANWLTAKGIPTVTLGCGQHEIHTTDEYVRIDEYLGACRVALEVMKA
jgi:tripeptide aminopeptidase